MHIVHCSFLCSLSSLRLLGCPFPLEQKEEEAPPPISWRVPQTTLSQSFFPLLLPVKIGVLSYLLPTDQRAREPSGDRCTCTVVRSFPFSCQKSACPRISNIPPPAPLDLVLLFPFSLVSLLLLFSLLLLSPLFCFPRKEDVCQPDQDIKLENRQLLLFSRVLSLLILPSPFAYSVPLLTHPAVALPK